MASGTEEQRRTSRQTDAAREASAKAMFEVDRQRGRLGNKPPEWEDTVPGHTEHDRERYRELADAAAHYDSRVDTWEHIARVRNLLDAAALELTCRGQRHDQSKLVSPEREAFDEHTPKLKEMTYGSSEYQEALAGMAPALVHHYAENSHHPEHYTEGVADMSLLDLVEMLCDWKAASERHDDGDIARSIEINVDRFGISQQLAGILRFTAVEMGWVTTGQMVAAVFTRREELAEHGLARKEEAGGERGD